MRLSKLTMVLIGISACGLIAAGCGDDGGGGTTEAVEEAATEATDVTAPSDEQIEEIQKQAEEAVENLPDDARERAKEACLQVAESLGGDARDAARESCEQQFD